MHQRDVARGQAYARHGRYVAERDRLTDRMRRQRQWSEEGVRNAKRKARDNDRVGRGMKVERSEQQAAKVRATERAIARLEAVDKPWEGWRLQLRLAPAAAAARWSPTWRARSSRAGRSAWGRSTSTCAAATASWSRARTAAARARCSAPCWAACPSLAGAARLGPSVVVGEIDQERTAMLGAPRLIDAFTARRAAA